MTRTTDEVEGSEAAKTGIDDPDVDGVPAADEVLDDGGRRGPAWLGHGWARPVVLALAIAFLAACVGYVVGAEQTEGTGPGLVTRGEVDVGFLQDMAAHHEQAVTMAIYATEHATDPIVRDFAREVIIFQRYELGLIDAYLAERGVGRADPDPERETMGWMGHPTPLRDMDGMASDEELERLADARGLEADLLFLELMSEHHRGGVHMAEFAALTGETDQVRTLARIMANNQQGEIAEYAMTMDRLRGEGG